LAHPTNFELPRRFDAQEEVFANRVRQQEGSGMSRALEAFFVTGMENRSVIKYGGPADTAFSKSVGIGMKTHCRNFGALKPDGKKRVRRLEMKDCGRRIRTSTQHVFERGVERNRIIHAKKIDTTMAERIRVPRYQLPMMLFAAEAKDSHAGM
jgi:hypothetical protein